MILKNVLYIPKFSCNLVSLSKLLKDYKITFSKKNALVYEGNVMVATTKIKHGVFVFDNIKIKNIANLVSSEKTNELWHRRFNHINPSYLKKLKHRIKDDAIFNYDSKQETKTCHPCLQGKAKEHHFPTSDSKARKAFDLIHSDVAYLECESIGRNKYYISFIDDYSSFSWVFPFRSKAQVPKIIINFHKSVKIQYNANIKCFRSDRGTEYTNQTVQDYFAENGIKHETSAPATPMQNGKSEVFNRVMGNGIRTLLVDSGLPKSLWGEALANVNYVRNRTPTSSNENFKTPFELLFGKLPDFNRLKIFGSIAFVLDKRVNKKKLDPKANPCIFVGYSYSSKAYRLLSLNLKEVKEQVSVKIDETMNYKQYKKSQDKQMSPESSEQEEVVISNVESESHSSSEAELSSSSEESDKYKETKIESETNVEPPEAPEPLLETKKQVEQKTKDSDSKPLTIPSPSKHTPVKQQTKTSSSKSNNTSMPQASKPSKPSSSKQSVKKSPERRSVRLLDKIKNIKYGKAVTPITINDPDSYKEAKNSPHWLNWKQAIDNELDAMNKNDVWKVVDKTDQMKPLSTRWVFKTKKAQNNEVLFRARLVAKGFAQVYGKDFNEIYSPVSTLNTVRTVIAKAVNSNQLIHQVDVKTAFLNADLKEEIYLEIPQGLKTDLNKVLKLKKSIYGLRQSPRCWNSTLNEFLISLGFSQSDTDTCLYTKNDKGKNLITIVVYVDDLLICCSDINLINETKKQLAKRFQIKDLGIAKKFLGFEISYDEKERNVKIHQSNFAEQLVTKFNMQNSKSVTTPGQPGLKLHKRKTDEESFDSTTYRSAIGGLLFLANSTRPDLTFPVSYASRFSSDPSVTHWKFVKHILRYLNSTRTVGIIYKFCKDVKIKFHADADFASDTVDLKSTTGNVVLFNESPVSWTSIKQSIVAISTTDAEIISLTSCVRTALNFKNLLKDLQVKFELPLEISGDNNSANTIVTNNVKSNKTKHLLVKYSFIKDNIDRNLVKIIRVDSCNNRADLLTKSLPRVKFSLHLQEMNVE